MASEAEEKARRVRSLLSSYYGSSGDAPFASGARVPAEPIDAPDFDAERYVRETLERTPLDALRKKCASMREEARRHGHLASFAADKRDGRLRIASPGRKVASAASVAASPDGETAAIFTGGEPSGQSLPRVTPSGPVSSTMTLVMPRSASAADTGALRIARILCGAGSAAAAVGLASHSGARGLSIDPPSPESLKSSVHELRISKFV